MSEIQSLTLRAQDLTRSVDWWNAAMIWGLAIASFAAVFVLISTRIVVAKSKELSQVQDQLGDAKDKQLALDLKAKDTQIELAKKGAAEATATAKGFESKIADSDARVKSAEAQVASSMARSDEAVAQVKTADARIAEAQRDAARANETAERERLARIQLEARLADRVITPAQKSRLTAGLAPFKGKTVDVVVFGDTPEVKTFSGAILDCLVQAGLFVNILYPMGGATIAKGVMIGTTPDAPETLQMAELFVSVLRESVGNGVGPWKFDDLKRPDGPTTVQQSQGAKSPGEFRIFIGSK